MSKIQAIRGRQVLDSRGNPTVEAEIVTKHGRFTAIVPSGASTGIHEALELRDKGKSYDGQGVGKAVQHINTTIHKKLRGKSCLEQEEMDNLMCSIDGTSNKRRLGANAMLAVSVALCKAGAAARGISLYQYVGKIYGVKPNVLPVPMCNIINGGKHAGQKNSIQEHMLIPVSAKRFSEGLRMVVETYHELRAMLKKKLGSDGVLIGDEGGFAPSKLKRMEDRFDIMLKAVKKAGYEGKMQIGIDAAASEFYYKDYYVLEGKKYSADKLIKHYEKLAKDFPLVSLEDGMSQDDWGHWKTMNAHLGKSMQLVGDDLFVTNSDRIREGILEGAANAVLIKVNQIGTVTETLEAMKLGHEVGWSSIVSHRSGETEDHFIADLVVGTNDGQCKFGAPARSDRNAKYNQLLRIEEDLGSKAKYPGKNFRTVGL